MLLNIRKQVRRDLRAVREKLLEERIVLLRKRKFRPVRTRSIYPIKYRWKASEARQEQQHCTKRRRAVYHWLSSLSSHVGDIVRVPREQRQTSTEFRLSKLHPTIRIFVNGTTIAASVHYRGRCWDLLQCLEEGPKRAADGWINQISAPGFERVYESVDALWKAEVFGPFRAWFELTLSTAEVLVLHGTRSDARGGTTWAKLMPWKTPVGPYEIARFPVWPERCPVRVPVRVAA